MKSSYSVFMQSRFFDPMFNSAVFDGPFRIYFNQMHESLALKIYFMVNQKLENMGLKVRELTKKTDAHVFILIYPSPTQFQSVFPEAQNNCEFISESVCLEAWDQDLVFGLKRPLTDEELVQFMDQVKQRVEVWYQDLLSMEASASESYTEASMLNP